MEEKTETVAKEDLTSDRSSATKSQTFCWACLRHMRSWIPIGYREEVVHISNLAGPVFISQVLIFLISFFSTVFCGHLGKTELAAVSLAIAVINVTGVCIGIGLASTCDTLISQTFGSNNLKRVGVILQRGILILLLACFPCWAVLINTEPLLLAFKQSPEVARLAQLYVIIFMPALPAAFMYQLEARYLQNQGIIWPQVITGIAGNILNALINYIFLYVLDMGVAGSAAANSISQYSLAVILFIYIHWRGLHKPTWGGWSMDCLREWDTFVHLAIPSMGMLCLEWWTYEIGGFIAALISEVELGAHSIAYEIATVVYMMPAGFSAAACVRVGNALGAGNTDQAKLSSKVSLLCTVVISFFVSVLLGGLKNEIGYIFTMDEEIVGRVRDVMVLYASFSPFESFVCVTGGIVRGAGKQAIGALLFLVGYYIVGLPAGVALMFAARMGVVGLWTGLFISILIQSIFFIILLVKINWKRATKKALIRAGVQPPPGADEGIEVDGTLVKQPSTQALAMEAQVTPGKDSKDPEKLPQKSHTTVGEVMSVRQLVLRRTLALFVMLLILAAGIVCNILVTDLLK
ncbi:hypothetical protein AGOR_G00025370 [Albula goreensis]|uniref:Multidrug and toxin extrusion protein n=1 Tax=Albula goreensis TaxID=1534307 RepID=A0A8T3E167_9TELE|nr:hypothetical protein AGOR_G00025370 [Albula goreensis]